MDQLWASDGNNSGRRREQLREQEQIGVLGGETLVCWCDAGTHNNLEPVDEVSSFVQAFRWLHDKRNNRKRG